MYISMSYSLSYALSFASVTAILFHTVLYHGKDIWSKVSCTGSIGRRSAHVLSQVKDSRAGGEDIHKRRMNVYREVPDW